MSASPRTRRLRIGAALVLLPLLLLALIAAWLLRSESGRDWALARVVAAAAPAELHWQAAEGVLGGELRVHQLHYRDARVQLQAERVTLRWRPLALLAGRVELERLQLRGLELQLEADDTPARRELPRLPLPFDVSVQQLELQQATLTQPQGELVLRHAQASLQLRRQGLDLTALQARGDFGRLDGALHYWPAQHFDSAAELRWQPPNSDAGAVTLTLRGDADALQLRVNGDLPEPAELRVQGQRLDAGWRWQLQLQGDALQPSLLGLPDDARWRLALDASLEGQQGRVQGELARADIPVVIAPSRLHLDQQRLHLDALLLQLPWGDLQAVGHVDVDDDARFSLRLTGSDWSWLMPADAGARVTAQFAAQLAGHIDAWSLEAEANLHRGDERARLSASGHGDRDALQLSTLQLTTPGGALQASAEVDWTKLQLALHGDLQGVDPGFLLPALPGRLHGQVRAKAWRGADQRWQLDVALSDLRGQLRQRPLQASGHWRGDADSGTGALDLRLGGSHVRARVAGKSRDWQLQLAPLQLQDLWPEAEGSLRGVLRGGDGALAAELQGDQLRWNAWRLHRLHLHGQLPATGDGGELSLDGDGLSLDDGAPGQLRLHYSGSRQRGRWRASLLSDAIGTLAAAGRVDVDGGELQQFDWQSAQGPHWSLAAASAWRHRPAGARLAPTCLQAEPARLCLELQDTRLQATLQRLPLAWLQPWLPNEPAMELDGELGLTLDAQALAHGWQGELRLHSDAGALRLAAPNARDLLRYREARAQAQFTPVGYTLEAAAQLGDAGHLGAELQGPWQATAPWQGRLQLALQELDWLELLSPDLAAVRGELAGELQLGGSRQAPRWQGELGLQAFSAELPALGLRLQRGALRLRGDPLEGLRLSGIVYSGAGGLQVDGHWPQPSQRAATLRLHGDNVTLADTPELRLVAAPDLQLQIDGNRLQLRGAVVLAQARIDLEGLESGVATSPDVVLIPAPEVARTHWQRDLDLRIVMGDAAELRGFGLDGRISGELRLRESDGRPPRGSGRLAVSGSYRAYGQALEISRGELRYADSPLDDPTLDLRVQRRIGEVEVGLEVRGRASSPRSRLLSTPAMDSSETLAWLLLGRPLSGTSRDQAAQLGAAASALDLGSSLLARSVGTRLGLDAAGVESSRTLGGSVLTVGKHLSPRLFIGYGVSLLGAGQVVTLKYALPHGFELAIESGRESSAALQWQSER